MSTYEMNIRCEADEYKVDFEDAMYDQELDNLLETPAGFKELIGEVMEDHSHTMATLLYAAQSGNEASYRKLRSFIRKQAQNLASKRTKLALIEMREDELDDCDFRGMF